MDCLEGPFDPFLIPSSPPLGALSEDPLDEDLRPSSKTLKRNCDFSCKNQKVLRKNNLYTQPNVSICHIANKTNEFYQDIWNL